MSEKKVTFIFPGQGAQYVKMGYDFYTQFSIARETFEEADEILGFSLSKMIFEGDLQTLTQTKNSQVAIYVTSIALLRVVREQFPDLEPTVCAGLSLGEYTALMASGRLTFRDGVELVRARGLYMDEASLQQKGTMAVTLGLTREQVNEVIASQKLEDAVWVANLNCPGQVVISGKVEAIDKIKAPLLEKGAKRVLPLEVSGAFHTPLMKSAQEKLEVKIATAPFFESDVSLVMNVPGDFVSDLEQLKANLVKQVGSVVRWEKGIREIDKQGIDLYLEIGCGKTLTGMNRKIKVSGESRNIEKVEDLDKLSACLDQLIEVGRG